MMSFWRNTGKPIKFLIFDGSAVIFILLLIFFTSVKMFIFCFLGMFSLAILNYFGYTIPNALRRFRIIATGKYKHAVPTKRMSRIDR